MRRLGVFLFAAAAVTPAGAADFYLDAASAPALRGTFDWTGFYAGINAGIGGDRFVYSGAGSPSELSLRSSEFLGGAQLGYNRQVTPQLVVGLEADIQKSGLRGTIDAASGATASAGAELDWFGTARARLGVATDRALVYGTGGLAYGTATTHSFDPGGATTGSTTTVKTGWTVGGGVEVGLTDNLTLKTEYLYVDLGADPLVTTSPGETVEETTRAHVMRAGLNQRF